MDGWWRVLYHKQGECSTGLNEEPGVPGGDEELRYEHFSAACFFSQYFLFNMIAPQTTVYL